MVIPTVSKMVPKESLPIVFLGCLLLICTAVFIVTVCTSIRRFHDMGMSGWYVLAKLIPVYNFYLLAILLFKEGDTEENKFGINFD